MPPYRLQVLLDIRTKAEEAAKDAFAEALKAADKEKKQLASMNQQLERMKVERKAKVQAFLQEMTAKGGGITAFQQMGRFEQRLKDEEAQFMLDIERQKEVVIQADALVEQRRAEMAEAAKEKKAIEKNKENWAKEVKKERQTKEEANQEEIGAVLHLARTRRENS
ncbi:MAG: flagellar assembly protein FliH [Archangium sp.]|nr:flagellar assembly protein FliH [Archangium sp.]MDP3151750.1 flagellar assembly protein FliH [Archangium sp.]MDP3573268.1 flagellar assembly protein FliH [Archangium sp.]